MSGWTPIDIGLYIMDSMEITVISVSQLLFKNYWFSWFVKSEVWHVKAVTLENVDVMCYISVDNFRVPFFGRGTSQLKATVNDEFRQSNSGRWPDTYDLSRGDTGHLCQFILDALFLVEATVIRL